MMLTKIKEPYSHALITWSSPGQPLDLPLSRPRFLLAPQYQPPFRVKHQGSDDGSGGDGVVRRFSGSNRFKTIWL